MVMESIWTLKTLTLTTTIGHSSEDPLSCLCDELETISVTGCSIIEAMLINVEVLTDANCNLQEGWWMGFTQ